MAVTPREARGNALGTQALVVACFLVLGVLLGLAVSPVTAPDSIGVRSEPAVIPVTVESFLDSRQVTVEVTFVPERQVIAPKGGTVTALACQAGEPLASGSSAVSLDGEAIVALATLVPPWRDFVPGIAGADVEALQGEFDRLGYNVGASGRYDAPTRAAVADLIRQLGGRAPTGTFHLSSIVWIPAPEVVIGTCEVQLGSVVTPGATIVALAAEIESGQISTPASDLVPGERLLVIDQDTFSLDPTGRLTDPADLERFATTPAVALFLESGGQVPVRGRYELAEPLHVTSVPPAAIVGGLDGTCLVAADGSAHRVRVVSSVAGRSLVTWETAGQNGTWPRAIYLGPQEEDPCS